MFYGLRNIVIFLSGYQIPIYENRIQFVQKINMHNFNDYFLKYEMKDKINFYSNFHHIPAVNISEINNERIFFRI